MSPEIDYTRQRTVAELLAEHGEAGGPGRRSRRRGDAPDRPGAVPAGPAGPPRSTPAAGPPTAHEPGPSASRAAYRAAPPASPRPGPSARRDRPTEMFGDRPRPAGLPGPVAHGAGGPRGAAPPEADRPSPSGPIRAVAPGSREPGRTSGSGPLLAVPPVAGPGAREAVPPGGRASGPPVSRPGPRDVPPPPGRSGGAGLRPGPAPATPWAPHRGAPGHPWPGAPAPAREQTALREPVGRPFLPASPLPVSHRPATGPARPAPRPGRVPDPGPETGAWDPFEFDDDEDGPETVVGAGDGARRGPARAPRRDAFPTLLDGPATDFDVTALRRGDGPATDFDVTSFDVTRRPGARGPAPDSAGGSRPAVLRPAFGPAARGRPPRGDVAPVGAAPPPPRVRPFARNVVDGPTELTDSRLDELEQLDGQTDVAAPRRPTPGAVDEAGDDVPFGVADLADDGPFDPHGLDDHRDDDLDDDLDDRDHVDVERDHVGLVDDDLLDDADDEHDAPRPAQAWAGVVAQWLAGALAGAVLWVLFRYLWRELPVVALAAAVLVTAGLVLLVRQLLHDADRRTTGFAVGVGLLLTASPAVLVLLGR